MKNNYIEIYTDGGCRGNGQLNNVGGYGILMSYNGYTKQFKKGFPDMDEMNYQIVLFALFFPCLLKLFMMIL